MFKLLKNKLIITLGFILFYKIGCLVPMPGLNTHMVANMTFENSRMLSMFLGSRGGLSILSFSVMPWVGASIIVQLLSFVVPYFERMKKEYGEKGRDRLDLIAKLLSLLIVVPQTVFMGNFLFSSGLVAESYSYLKFIVVMVIVSSCSCLSIVWLAQQVNEHGLGSGVSLIITLNIFNSLITQKYDWLSFVVIAVTALVITVFESFYYRVDLLSPKHLVQKIRFDVDGKLVAQICYIPIKLNIAGVMGAVFASSIMGVVTRVVVINNKIVYHSVFFVFLTLFTTVYSIVNISADEVTKSISKSGCLVKGMRGGETTENFINRITVYNSFISSLFMILVALAPEILAFILKKDVVPFGGTSLFIIVGTANEIIDHIKAIVTEAKHL